MSWWSRSAFPRLVDAACRSHAILEERRRWIPRAHGDVLELGVGTGLNLAFYAAGRATKVTGIDPAPALLARARTRAAAGPVAVELVEGVAERLPFDAGRFDSAVVTYSLCSIADPAAALAELRRVLRPGGELFFVEHGLAPSRVVRGLQRAVTPAWRRVAGGCRLDRDVPAVLASGGFTCRELEIAGTTYKGVAQNLLRGGG